MTDARDVHDKVLSETGLLPQQPALTQEIAIFRERLVPSSASISCTAHEKMTMQRSHEGPQKVVKGRGSNHARRRAGHTKTLRLSEENLDLGRKVHERQTPHARVLRRPKDVSRTAKFLQNFNFLFGAVQISCGLEL